MFVLSGKNCWYLALVVILSISSVSAVRINEIELNPAGSDSENEFIELYSLENADLNGWVIQNSNGKNISLDFSFSGYYLIYTKYGFLTNDNQKISLINTNGDLVDQSSSLSDGHNDARSWQYCDSWIFASSTPGSVNSCQNQENKTDFYIKLEYDKEFRNGETLDIKVLSFNLEDSDYDLKIYLEHDGDIISEGYNSDLNMWKSGTYYLKEIISGPGNRSKTFELRVSDEYDKLKGVMDIIARLRKSQTAIEKDYQGTVRILEKEIINDTAEEENIISEVNDSSEIIKLGNPKDIKSQNVWKSKIEYIKQYSIYGFILLCIILVIFLIVKKAGDKKFKR